MYLCQCQLCLLLESIIFLKSYLILWKCNLYNIKCKQIFPEKTRFSKRDYHFRMEVVFWQLKFNNYNFVIIWVTKKICPEILGISVHFPLLLIVKYYLHSKMVVPFWESRFFRESLFTLDVIQITLSQNKITLQKNDTLQK